MMHMTRLTVTAIIWMCAVFVLAIDEASAQERLIFDVGAENTKYTEQHVIDVGDVPGHQVRIFEIHRTYPGNAPKIDGIRIVGSWTRGISDYTNNNGEAHTYGVYVLENGDKFFTRGSLIAIQSPEESNLSATTVGPIIGGTGKLSGINGMARTTTSADPKSGLNATHVEISYWLPGANAANAKIKR
jgi:hypothetical protein